MVETVKAIIVGGGHYTFTADGVEKPIDTVVEFERPPEVPIGHKDYIVLKLAPIEGGEILDVDCDKTRYDPQSYGWVWNWREDYDVPGGYRCDLSRDHNIWDGSLATTTVESIGPSVEVASPFNRLFTLNSDKLIQLSDVMPEVTGVGGGQGGAPTPQAQNHSGWIINLIQLGFKLPESVIGPETEIVIGGNKTGVRSERVISDLIRVDLGEIEVTDLSNSTIDHTTVIYELTLPFASNVVELDAEDVVGKKVRVEYVLEPYNGSLTLNLYNGGELPFHSSKDSVGRDLPIHLFNNLEVQQGSLKGLSNGFTRATIKARRAELVEGEFSNLIKVNDVLGNNPGYVEVVNAEIRGIPNSDKVLTLLKGGIIVRP